MIASAALDALVVAAPICAPTEAQRSTGTIRYPEKIQHWDEATQHALLNGREPQSGPVVAVLVVEGFGSVVVGPFPSPDAAFGWWSVPWNRLREYAKIVLRPAPAPKLRCPSFRPCGESDCPVCGAEVTR